MPVMMLSAVLDEDEQVRALEAGADDYVTKPFRPRELVARLLAHLRRADLGSEEPSLNLDGLVIDRTARAVSRDGDEIYLTPIEFKLLSVLLQNPGRLLTHNALLQRVWGPAYIDAKQMLRGHMANLRRKIEPVDGGHLIRTHHGLATSWPERLVRTLDKYNPSKPSIPNSLGALFSEAIPERRRSGWRRPAEQRRGGHHETPSEIPISRTGPFGSGAYTGKPASQLVA